MDKRMGLREGVVESADAENFMYDVGPLKCTAAQTIEVSAIVSKLRSAAVAESRPVVTESRDQYEGHISFRERHLIGNLPR